MVADTEHNSACFWYMYARVPVCVQLYNDNIDKNQPSHFVMQLNSNCTTAYSKRNTKLVTNRCSTCTLNN